MPLVVSSLMGDPSDVFDWILSLNPGNTQDLTTLLQMLREHYCGSLTFWEQRNMIENLCKKPQEAAIDFLIRVSTSVSNLSKDWKDKLTDKELQSLQSEDEGPYHHESSSHKGANPFGAESSQEDDEGLFIPSYLEEALPDDPVLQVKMAHAMSAEEVDTRRCFTCN